LHSLLHRERAGIHLKQDDNEMLLKDSEAALELKNCDPEPLAVAGLIAQPRPQRLEGKFNTPPIRNR
jgi:hypothetical protein